MNDQKPRMQEIRALLREAAPLLVAFSGGVDSTLVLRLALEEVGREGVLAVTAHGDVHTEEETRAAREAAARLGSRHLVVRTKELSIAGFADNSPERCYLCRSEFYAKLGEIARLEGLRTVVDGANSDDAQDYRPGMRAAIALGVRSPLVEAGVSKDKARVLAKELGLTNWDLPSSPCLASRFPYGERITHAKLETVGKAERFLRGLGFSTVRVRHHGQVARVELVESDLPRAAEESMRRAIVRHLQELGYVYVTLDLTGFRSGSLNEALRQGPLRTESGGPKDEMRHKNEANDG